MGGEAGMDDAAYCATTRHKSSCASSNPSDTETAAARDDDISDHNCTLAVVWHIVGA